MDRVVKSGYKSQAEDTDIKTDQMEFALLRQRTNSDRFLMALAHTQGARRLSLSGLKYRFPHLDAVAFATKVAQVFLCERYNAQFMPEGNEMTWIQDSLSLAATLHPLFEASDIPYYITGGVAASTFGDPRTTRDLDVVIAVSTQKLETLVHALEANRFYVPGLDDVRSGRMRTLSITHQESIARADLMVAGTEPFDRQKMVRRRLIEIIGIGAFYFASPEDVILNKLRWRQRSDSEKQWRDVLGILKVQGETLDMDYLGEWAAHLDLLEDLAHAIDEAGL